MCSLSKPIGGGSGPQDQIENDHSQKRKGVLKKHPPVVPATGVDTKTTLETVSNGSPTSTGSAGQGSSLSKPTITITPPPITIATSTATAPTPVATAAPSSAAPANTNTKELEKTLKKITLLELINRQSSVFNVLPNSLNKKIQGADVIILSALAGLKKSEEALDCQESDTQAQLGSAVQAIIKNKNLTAAEDLLKLSERNEIFLDKTYRENLRKFISECQNTDDVTFQEEYNKSCSALQQRLREHIQKSKKYDDLIDGTYKLGGKRNLTDDEIAFLQGNKSKLTKEQQEVLRKKQHDRTKAGLSDNEEEHPEFVDPQNIIKVPASALSALKPGSKSLKAGTCATAAAKK